MATSKQASKQANIHTRVRNAVPLVHVGLAQARPKSSSPQVFLPKIITVDVNYCTKLLKKKCLQFKNELNLKL